MRTGMFCQRDVAGVQSRVRVSALVLPGGQFQRVVVLTQSESPSLIPDLSL